MSTENTIENNKLLADFMNIEKATCQQGITRYNFGDGLGIEPDEMQYQYSWDWLMQVVEKIERMRSGSIGMQEEEVLAYITITENYCEVQTTECIFEPENEKCTKIEAVYSTVLQFVKWYNSKPELHV